MLRRALRLASASAAVLAVAACVSQPKPSGPAAPGTPAASSAPPTLDGATVPAISVESSAPQPAVATYSCADGGKVTIRNVGSSVRVLGQDGIEEELNDKVAEEVPVALTYHGVPYVVMLASPLNLDDLALGFTLSEGIVAHRSEVTSVEVRPPLAGAYAVDIGISSERFSELLRRQRNTTGRTGCGLCGEATVEEAIRPVPKTPAGVRVEAGDLHRVLRELCW